MESSDERLVFEKQQFQLKAILEIAGRGAMTQEEFIEAINATGILPIKLQKPSQLVTAKPAGIVKP